MTYQTGDSPNVENFDVSERDERLQELLDNSLRTFAMMVLRYKEIREADIEMFLTVVIPELSELFEVESDIEL